jgi:outer membrane protein, heavy metal efflux system
MRFALSIGVCAGLVFAIVGCQRPLRLTPEKSAALAAGLHEALVFRAESGPVNAADVPDSTISLAEAIRLTVTRSPRIQAALARVRMAEAESDQARLVPNPIISLTLRFPEGGGKTIIEAGLAAELVALLQRPGLASAADNRLRAEAANAVATVLDVVAEVREKYVGVQTADELLLIHEDRRRLLGRLLEVARARLNAGEATQLDVTTLETQRVELETEIADKELERSERRLSLGRLMGIPSSDAGWRLEKWEEAGTWRVTERQWVELALARSPEVVALEFELKALGAERSLSHMAPFEKTEVGVDAERDDVWSLGPAVSVPLPVFDDGRAARARASAAVIEARHKLQEAQRGAIENTRRAYATHRWAKANLSRVQNQLIPLQEKRLAQAEAQYQAGHADITTLFLAEQDLRAARARLVELQQRQTEALIRLERVAGGSGTVRSVLPATQPTSLPATRAVQVK